MSLTGLLSEIRKQRCYYMSSFRTGSLTVHVHANVAEMASAAAEASAKIIANRSKAEALRVLFWRQPFHRWSFSIVWWRIPRLTGAV